MDITPHLKKLFPEGTIGPGSGKYQGECISFCHALADFDSIGDTFQQKKKFVDLNGIIRANIDNVGKGFRVGDVVITSDGVDAAGRGAGHGFVVANLDDQFLYPAEANWFNDKRVHYGRKVAKTDPHIYGVIRAPLKLDLGQCEVNYNVFINNQPRWNLKFLDDLQKQILQWTGNKLRVNFFPLYTKCENWWYEVVPFPFDGLYCKVIAKSYFDNTVIPLTFTSQNKFPHAVALIIRPDQWEGTIFGKQNMTEIGWTNPCTNPGQIQISSAEFDLSPWYAGVRLINHALPHELAHYLHFVNGLNDTTHQFDNPGNRQLEQVFSDLDLNRLIANL